MKLLRTLLFGKTGRKRKIRRKKPPLLLRLLDKVCSIPLNALEGKWNNDLWNPGQ